MIETNFKHTDIGPIPHDWEITPLNELFEFGNGYTPSTENPKFWSNRGLPWFKMEDIRKNGRILSDSILHITPEAVKSSGLFPAGSFIISTTATIGEHAWLIADSLANQRFTFLKKGKSLKDIDSWYFFFKLFEIGEWCRNNVSKSTLLSVNMTGLKSYLVSHPSDKKEQQRIGKALSDVDGLIEGLRKLIEKKRNIKQGAMSRLLSGSLRLPGFNKSWENFRIGDLSSVQAGATPSTEKSEYWNGDIRWMNSGEINLKYVREVQNRITQKGYDSTSTHMLPLHCVLLGLAGQGKTRGTAAINLVELCTNQSIAAIYPSDCFDSFFLYHLLDSKYSDLRMLSSGEGTRGGLTKRQIENIELLMPTDLAEQSAIAKVLTDMDAEIEGLEKKLAKYGQVKQGMMKQLLTGKIRLI
jgi:type I restriction enzyme S subunit